MTTPTSLRNTTELLVVLHQTCNLLTLLGIVGILFAFFARDALVVRAQSVGTCLCGAEERLMCLGASLLNGWTCRRGCCGCEGLRCIACELSGSLSRSVP